MKNLSWLYILLILAGCTDMSVEDISIISNEKFYATIEQTDSRTYVDDQIRLRWTAEDCITLFRKTTYNREYMFTGTTGANAGGFRQKSVDDDFWYGADVPYNYAIYPHSSTTQLDETDFFFTFTMPDEQIYAENSFGLGANTMVAVSESGQLTFKNVGSYLRVRLYGEDVSVSSITLTSKGNEAIAGTAKITPSKNGNPTCEMTGTGKSIRLTCPEPVIISTDANNPTDFWIVVPPVTLESGFSVTVENSTGDTQVYDVNKSFTFERNMYTDMKREVKNIPYVTFTADAEQTLTMSNAVETLEYSVNGEEWKELGTNTITFGNSLGNLRLRGKNENGTGNGSYPYTQIKFGKSSSVACVGDIRTLLDYENYETVSTSKAQFCYLFANCRTLISAPELPAMNLADSCYYNMFKYCINLTSAPQLPAKLLSKACYFQMFNHCEKITIAPELPATTLVNSCYSYMFDYCTNLKTAPKLPAKTLAGACYSGMFRGCQNMKTPPQLPVTSLAGGCYNGMFQECRRMTIAPELPATTLTPYCYQAMFKDCDSLEYAPQLPAKVLTENCYAFMFSGCNKLKAAPELPATTLSKGCYSHMFCDCANLTVSPELPATNLAQSCYEFMFDNCRNLIQAPDLPATTLANQCYASMFSNCTSLITAPQLPAKKLEHFCYASMFRNCSKLENITMLATDIGSSTDECLSIWVSGVSSIGRFTKDKNMTSLPNGENGIPTGWTIINQ